MGLCGPSATDLERDPVPLLDPEAAWRVLFDDDPGCGPGVIDVANVGDLDIQGLEPADDAVRAAADEVGHDEVVVDVALAEEQADRKAALDDGAGRRLLIENPAGGKAGGGGLGHVSLG